MDYAAVVFLEIIYMIAFLALTSAGLAVVFGMMRVINLAHGEFVMIGGYTTIACAKAGINIYFAMLVVSPLVVGILGLLVERLVVRQLYGRMIDTMLATWGLSLLMVGIVTFIFGNTAVSVPAPIPGRHAKRRCRFFLGLRPQACLHVDIRCRRGFVGFGRRRVGAIDRTASFFGGRLYRQGIHHRHHGRGRSDHGYVV